MGSGSHVTICNPQRFATTRFTTRVIEPQAQRGRESQDFVDSSWTRRIVVCMIFAYLPEALTASA